MAGVIGDPAPLGLAAFGTSTLVAGTVLAGWWPAPGLQLLAIAPVLLVFGGIVQFIAAMWGYGRGQSLLATFLGTFGAFFATAGVYGLAVVRTTRASSGAIGATDVLGPLAVGVACFAFIALFVAFSSAVADLALTITTGLLAIGLGLLAWAFFAQGNTVLEAIAGWFGVVSGAVALLAAAGSAAGMRFTGAGFRPSRPAA